MDTTLTFGAAPMSLLKRELLWFGAGFAIAAVLSANLGSVRYLPIGLSFGLLCFLCGLLLHQFISLRKEREELGQSRKSALQLMHEWHEKDRDLMREKQTFEAQRKEWEENKESAFFLELARMTREEPETLSAFHKRLLHMAEDEAARRGGEQIDDDIAQMWHFRPETGCSRFTI